MNNVAQLAPEGPPPQPLAGEQPLAAGNNLNWVGVPSRIEEGKTYYKSAKVGEVTISLGDHVYLQPADPDVPLYIARIDELFQQSPEEIAAFGWGAGPNPGMVATVAWYYRPAELDIDSPLPVYLNEIFAADERAIHPLNSVCGRCEVYTPGHARAQVHIPHIYICNRKYIPYEGRVIPLEGTEDEPRQLKRTHVLVDHQVYPEKKVGKASNGGGAVAASNGQGRAESAQKARAPPPVRAPSKRKRREREHYSPEYGTPTARDLPPPPSQINAKRASPPRSGLGGSTTSSLAAPAASETAGAGPSAGGAATPRSRAGRWTKDRYDAAQRSLIHILRMMGATSPHKAVLRPSLREEARKVIGDTGLLDHLLKHLADQVVSGNGERLRRRHNREGHMEYWLQNPEAAVEEEAMLKDEMQALSAELREVREARHVLQSVRNEAAQAIQAVSVLKDDPEHAARSLGAVVSGKAGGLTLALDEEVNARLDAVEMANIEIKRRVFDAESLAASGLEEVRKEVADAGALLEQHISSFSRAAHNLDQRCATLERQSATMVEDQAGRFEALSGALGEVISLREELSRRDEAILMLHRDVNQLKEVILGMASLGQQNAAAAAAAAAARGNEPGPPTATGGAQQQPGSQAAPSPPAPAPGESAQMIKD